MRAIIILLVLLGAGTAGAGQIVGPLPDGPGVHPNNVGKCFESVDGSPGEWTSSREVPCLPLPEHRVMFEDGTSVPLLCLAKMEAAMRAMDQMIEWNPITQRIVLDPFRKKHYEVMEQWTAAKDQCWRQP